MPFITRTLDELTEIIRADMRTRIPGADVSRGSDYDILARIVAAAVHGNQAHALYLSRQILPSTAERTWLERHATLRGLVRAPAAAATGKALLTASSGTPTQAAGSTLTAADGTAYTTAANGVVNLPGWAGKSVGFGATRTRIPVTPSTSGMVAGDPVTINGENSTIREVLTAFSMLDLTAPLTTAPSAGDAVTALRGVEVTITATTAGARTNKDAREALALASPTSPISSSAIALELSGGGDLETDDELRRRLLAFLANRPGAGNVADFRMWARETPGVRLADCWVYPGFDGLGTVALLPVGVEGAQVVGPTVLGLVEAHVAELASFADHVDVLAWEYSPAATDVTVAVTYGIGFEPDWSGTFTTSGAQSTTSIGVSASPVGVIEVGDRVVVPLTVGAQLVTVERVVTSVSASAIGVEALPVAAAVGVTVRPGGPLAQPVLDAIGAVFDALGPGDPNDTRHPAPAEEWPATLYRAALAGAILEVSGVLNVTVTAPVADVEPAILQRVRLGTVAITWVAP